MDIISLLLTLAVAFAGGFLGKRLRLPAGPMVGAILFVAAFNLITQRAAFDPRIKAGLQLLSGAMVASRIGREDVASMRRLLLPGLILVVGMIAFNLVFGGMIDRWSGLDTATALFAVAPGGMSDMALISAELGANTSYVSILQLSRVLFIFAVMPPLFRRRLNRTSWTGVHAGRNGGAKPARGESLRLLALLGWAAAGGLAFRALGVSAGGLTGSMLAGAIYCVARGKVAFPSKLKFCMQTLSGAFIGAGIDRATAATLPSLGVPLLILFAGILAFEIVTAWALRRLFKLDPAVCMLTACPGGIQEMSLLSEDLGADTPKIAVLHTVRVLSVILLFPTLLRWITGLWSD